MKKSNLELLSLAEILTAAKNGRMLQFKPKDSDNAWVDDPSFSGINTDKYDYRIKPTEKLVPLGIDDMDVRCISGMPMWIREEKGSRRFQIVRYNTLGVFVVCDRSEGVVLFIRYEDLQRDYRWVSGTTIDKPGYE